MRMIPRAEQLLHTLQRVASRSNLHLNLKKCVPLSSPTHLTQYHYIHRRHASHYRAARQQRRLHPQRHHNKLCEGPQTLPHASPVLAQLRPHTQVEAQNIQRRFHTTRHLRAGIGRPDHQRLQQNRSIHSQSLRKILHLKSTYYTEVLQLSARTYTHQEVRFLTEQPPLHTTSTKHN